MLTGTIDFGQPCYSHSVVDIETCITKGRRRFSLFLSVTGQEVKK